MRRYISTTLWLYILAIAMYIATAIRSYSCAVLYNNNYSSAILYSIVTYIAYGCA